MVLVNRVPVMVSVVGVLLVLLSVTHARLEVLYPSAGLYNSNVASFEPRINGTWDAIAFQQFGLQNYNVTGFGGSAEELDACGSSSIDMAQAYGALGDYIVVVPFGPCPTHEQAANALDQGASGLLVWDTVHNDSTTVKFHWFANVFWRRGSRYDIPIALIPQRVGLGLTEYTGTVAALLSQPSNATTNSSEPPLSFALANMVDDENVYIRDTRVVGPFLMAVNGGLNVILIGVGVYRFYGFVQEEGMWVLSTPKVVLTLDFVAAGIRALYWCIDPVYLYGVYSWYSSQILIGMSSPWQSAASLFIAIYWHKLIRSHNVSPIESIRWMFIPFTMVFCALLGIEIWVEQARLTWALNAGDKGHVSGIVVGTTNIVTGSAYLLSGFALLFVLYRNQIRLRASSSARGPRLWRLTLLVAVCGVGHIISGMGSIIISPDEIGFRDDTFIGLVSMIVFANTITGLSHILSFVPKEQRYGGSTKTGGGSSKEGSQSGLERMQKHGGLQVSKTTMQLLEASQASRSSGNLESDVAVVEVEGAHEDSLSEELRHEADMMDAFDANAIPLSVVAKGVAL